MSLTFSVGNWLPHRARCTFKAKVGLKVTPARGPQVSPRYAATPAESDCAVAKTLNHTQSLHLNPETPLESQT